MNIKNLTNGKKNYVAPSMKAAELESGDILITGSEENGQTEGYRLNRQSLDDEDWE